MTNAKNNDPLLFEKADTVALWHAVEWMGTVLSEWRREGFKSEIDQAQYDAQHATLMRAKRAVRKANAIRKAQRCRTAAKLQVEHKTAGGPAA